MIRKESNQNVQLILIAMRYNELAPRADCHDNIKFVSPSGDAHILRQYAHRPSVSFS